MRFGLRFGSDSYTFKLNYQGAQNVASISHSPTHILSAIPSVQSMIISHSGLFFSLLEFPIPVYRILVPAKKIPPGVLDKGSNGDVRQISPHPVPCRIKDRYPKSVPYRIKILPKVYIIHYFKRTLEKVLTNDTLSHNFIRKGYLFETSRQFNYTPPPPTPEGNLNPSV